MKPFSNPSQINAHLQLLPLIQAMEVSRDAATFVDLDGRVTYANPAAGELLGCRPYEVTGRFLWDMMDDPALVAQMMETTLTHGQWRGKVGLRRHDDQIFLPWRTALIQSQEGDVLGMISIGDNPVPQKELADRLERFERQRRLGELAAGVAHNVNQIFTVILGRAQLLTNEAFPPQVQEEIRNIVEAANKGAELVGRIQADVMGLAGSALGPVDVNEVVCASIESTRPKWRDSALKVGCTIEVTTDLQATCPVLGRVSEVDEVLVNLIFNAVEAMPDGGAIHIRTWDESGQVCLSVADAGMGMDLQTQGRLGELFFTTKKDGHGIGLATCFRTVNEMGGKITCDSALGKGTTFLLQFPAGEAPSTADASAALPSSLPSRHILVIDDEEIIRKYLVQALSGHQVDVAAEGESGLALFREKRHDIVLVDLSLPGMNGVAVARQVRALAADTSIVLMTGWGRLPNEMASHFQAFLHKPFTIQDLSRLLAQLIA